MTEERHETALVPAEPSAHYAVAPHEYYAIGGGDSGETDWRHLGNLVWSKKWWIVAAGLLGAAGGVVGTRFISPEYVTRASIWIDQSKKGGGPIRAADVFQGEGWINVLNSRAVLRPVVDELQLYVRPEAGPADSALFKGFELATRTLPGTYTLDVGARGDWILSREGSGEVERGQAGASIGESVGFVWTPTGLASRSNSVIKFHVSSPQQAVARLRKALRTTFNEDASLIDARITWSDPERAAQVLNVILDNFMRTATDLKNQRMREQIRILREQTRVAEERLRNAELALQNFKVNTITLPTESQANPIPGGLSTQGTVFGAYFQKKIEADNLESDLDQIIGLIRRARTEDSVDVMALQLIPSIATSPGIQAAIQEYNSKKAQIRTLLYTYTEEYEGVRTFREELAILGRQTLPALLQQLAEQLTTRLATVNEQIQAQGRELQEIPYRTIEETRLTRELSAAASLHGNLQGNLKQVELAEATSFPDMQILDAAVPPTRPQRTEAGRIVLMASLGGLGIGLAGVLLFNLLDRRIRYPTQITSKLGLPVLGIVPRLETRAGKSEYDAHVAIESFRSIRTQLSHAGGNGKGVTMITSPAPRDGKSMVAANLAISHASAGHRTLLLDADTRRGRAQEMFGLPSSPGLADVLIGRASLEEVQQETSVDNLALLARGSSAGFSADLLEGEAMSELMDELRARYEVIVIDAPPLVAGADAVILGGRCDAAVLVVRAGETDQELARTKLAMLGNCPMPLVGAILNAVPNTASYYYHYASQYYAEIETVS
ncbi:MAG: polysaccharide biosynthesis tyrosine autokinase [Gemmatimonadota bacterium]